MAAPWDFILGKAPGDTGAAAHLAASAHPAADGMPTQVSAERDDLLHVRFGYMAERLQDLKSLSEEFCLLAKPIEDMSIELPKAKARIRELETALRHEMEERARLRRKLEHGAEELSVLSADYDVLLSRNKAGEEELDHLRASVAAARAGLGEAQQFMADAEQQLEAEQQASKRLQKDVAELKALAASRADEVRAAHDLTLSQANQSAALELEVARLQGLIDKQAADSKAAQDRLREAERQAQDRARDLGDLQQKLSAEQAARQHRDHAHELALSGLSAEKASLALQLEAMTGRANAAEQLVGQSGHLLTEKDAAIRNFDGLVRSLEKQFETAERQTAALEQRLGAKAAELTQAQGTIEDLAKRCEDLGKTLSAKETALAGAVDKAKQRSEKVEELTRSFELERASLEASHRKLLEELENERAERTLAQGALNIARENRASLQRLNETLRRANRSFQPSLEEVYPGEPETNVSFLPLGRKVAGDE